MLNRPWFGQTLTSFLLLSDPGSFTWGRSINPRSNIKGRRDSGKYFGILIWKLVWPFVKKSSIKKLFLNLQFFIWMKVEKRFLPTTKYRNMYICSFFYALNPLFIMMTKFIYSIYANSFRPWIVSAPVCTVTKGHSTYG